MRFCLSVKLACCLCNFSSPEGRNTQTETWREKADRICLSSTFEPLVRTPVRLYGPFASSHRKQILWQKAILLSIQCADRTVCNENIAHVKPWEASSCGHSDWGSILGSKREFFLSLIPLQTSCMGTICLLSSGYYGLSLKDRASIPSRSRKILLPVSLYRLWGQSSFYMVDTIGSVLLKGLHPESESESLYSWQSVSQSVSQ
jgi:hypothetical protein